MRRKLQVFISSTYLDLKQERQAAVEAVLEAGHIPAGMELFAAGDKSQLETIRRWIDDSDVFLLILGGRYGSIEPESSKSYIELEYLHAVERQMPHFALVLKESAIDAKLKRDGASAIDNPVLLKKFREAVTQKMCSFVEDTKDIKLAIYKSLKEITDGNQGLGWVSAEDAPDSAEVARELAIAVRENSELRRQVAALEERIRLLTKAPNRDVEFKRIWDALASIHVEFNGKKTTPLNVLFMNKEVFISGVNNAWGSGPDMEFLFFKVAPHLKMYGLMEDYKVPGVKYQIQRISKLGNEFLAWMNELHLRAGTKVREPQEDNAAESRGGIGQQGGTAEKKISGEQHFESPQAVNSSMKDKEAPSASNVERAPAPPARAESGSGRSSAKAQSKKKKT